MSEFWELSALQLARAVAEREISPVEVTEVTLRRAEAVNEQLGAFASLAGDYALAQAREVEQQVMESGASGQLPPLVGVPCPIKDLAQVKGLPFEAGSAALAGNIAPVSDSLVGWLREAGTVMVGKTATPEFGLPPYTEPANHPPARTPWDLRRGAGGSSGGAGAAVSAGLVPIAHASDGGGSIRIPASVCGLVGFKASRGLVSPGAYKVAGPGLSTDGVLTRTVRDSAVGMDVLARCEPGVTYHGPGAGGVWAAARAGVVSSSGCVPATSFLAACNGEKPSGLRVGVLTRPVITSGEPIHAECLAATNRAARLLESLGHYVSEAPVPFDAERFAAFAALWKVMALNVPVPPGVEEKLRPFTRHMRQAGREVTGLQYSQAVEAVQQMAWDTAQVWADFDVILTPTLAMPPAFVGQIRNDQDPEADFAVQTAFTPWTSIANLTGRPSISLPLHRAEIDGIELPFGVMLTGRWGGDALLYALSAHIEVADPWPTLPKTV